LGHRGLCDDLGRAAHTIYRQGQGRRAARHCARLRELRAVAGVAGSRRPVLWGYDRSGGWADLAMRPGGNRRTSMSAARDPARQSVSAWRQTRVRQEGICSQGGQHHGSGRSPIRVHVGGRRRGVCGRHRAARHLLAGRHECAAHTVRWPAGGWHRDHIEPDQPHVLEPHRVRRTHDPQPRVPAARRSLHGHAHKPAACPRWPSAADRGHRVGLCHAATARRRPRFVRQEHQPWLRPRVCDGRAGRGTRGARGGPDIERAERPEPHGADGPAGDSRVHGQLDLGPAGGQVQDPVRKLRGGGTGDPAVCQCGEHSAVPRPGDCDQGTAIRPQHNLPHRVSL
ncbi:hypothetical protein IWW52_005865, partial [Coemansia sp. RSA 2704]